MPDLRAKGGSQPALLTYFLVQESRQRAGPCCPIPFAALRGKAAPSTSCCGTAKFPTSLQGYVQTRCRQFDNGAAVRHKRPPAQARQKVQYQYGYQIASDFVTTLAQAVHSPPAARCFGCGQCSRKKALLCEPACSNVLERCAASARRVLPYRSTTARRRFARRRSRRDADCRACALSQGDKTKAVL